MHDAVSSWDGCSSETSDASEPSDGDRADAPAVDHCDAATRLNRGETLTDQSTATGGAPSTACRPSDAPQRFYTFELPAHYRAVVTVTSESATHLVARALARCDVRDCLTDAETSDTERTVTLTIDSPGDIALTKIITVSTTRAAEIGTFRIKLDLFAPLPPPVAETCETATPLTDGTFLRDQFVAAGGAPYGMCPAGAGPQHFYTLTIPAGRRGLVVVAPQRGDVTSLINPVARLMLACDATSCVDQDWTADRNGNHVANGYAAVGYDNHGASPVTVIATVSNPATDATAMDLFTIRAQLEPLPTDVPPNVVCSAAIPFPMASDPSGFVTFDTNAATEHGTPCPDGIATPGRTFFYTVMVPAGSGMELALLGRFALARLRDHCDAATCIVELANTDDGDDQRFTYRNTTGSAQTLVLEIGARNALPIQFFARVRIVP